ncbi:Zinc finger protein with KRAB and SCAN domains 1 [Eumeta japonica]|uniref:Zinc finger protein with KRAB and SCAN domains 1 n=1 Tax=Eumeta variegata TaxID=151549 RepID=A0A4C1XT33_EUMVA|nr:Zinc finger protein with KRAB and SCAN domains 1 [Eumeta japonica]
MEVADRRRSMTQGLPKRYSLSKRLKYSSGVACDRDASGGSLKFFTSIQELAERVVEREIYVKAKREDRRPFPGYARTTSPDTYRADDSCIDAFIKQELTIGKTVIHRLPARMPPHIAKVPTTERPLVKQEVNETEQLKDCHQSTMTGDKVHTACMPHDMGEDYISKHCNAKKSAPSALKVYSCDLCNLKFIREHDLCKHKCMHTNDKSYVCNMCSAKFPLVYNLKIHKRMHNEEKPLYCDMCDAKFMTKNNLRMHMNGHRNNRAYSCSVCDDTSESAGMLHTHTLLHTDQKPYNCDLCDANFTLSDSLKVHKRIHSLDKPFGCSMCEAMFRKGSYLKQHIKRKHTDGTLVC